MLSTIESAAVFAQLDFIALGDSHAHALDSSGVLYSWGNNDFGQLATGMAQSFLSPRLQTHLKTIRLIGAQQGHSCIVDIDGGTRCFGRNNFGELGLGMNSPSVGNVEGQELAELPLLNLGGDVPTALILGYSHTCYVNQNSLLKCFGSNLAGELGIGSKKKRVGLVPEDMGKNLVAVKLGNLTPIEGCAGNQFTCVRSEVGEVKCFGHGQKVGNQTGEHVGLDPSSLGNSLKVLDLGNNFKAAKISCAESSACALSVSGEIKCWGKNTHGSLGAGLAEGEVVGNKPGSLGNSLPSIAIEPYLRATDVACGGFHCCAVLENGGLKCWGDNQSGQLGLGDTRNRGQIIADMGANLRYVDLGSDYSAERVWAGSMNTCAQLQAGKTVKCWGTNRQGQLGIGKLSMGAGSSPYSMGDFLPGLSLTLEESQ